ncbi:MAG: DegT/DnrJ/EryC1/StrS aminotransferase family protein [Sideroxydans sp.]
MPSWPYFAEDEIEAVRGVLVSGKVNYWTGQLGRQFEHAFAEYHEVTHAVAVANGTLALELALQALGIGAGDEVIIPARTFIATASCVVARGATPVVVDIEPDSQTISADAASAAITPRTRAIIAVHLGGWPCDMNVLHALARKHGLKLIEDCAQAIGAEYYGRKVGSFGDAAAFSFCQDKIMTTGGEGGMLLLKDEAAWKKAWAYKDHGKDLDLVFHATHPPGHRWLHTSFGSNFRMTELQAAIGLQQLHKLPAWLKQRRKHALILMEGLRDLPAVKIPGRPEWVVDAFYRVYAFLDRSRLKADWNQDRIVAALNAEGIICFHGSCSEIYREKAFEPSWPQGLRLPVAKHSGETSIAFQVHPTLAEDDMWDTVKAVHKVLQVATIR